MATKGIPKKDGSGGGQRANRGRGGCVTTKVIGQGGRNFPLPQRPRNRQK